MVSGDRLRSPVAGAPTCLTSAYAVSGQAAGSGADLPAAPAPRPPARNSVRRPRAGSQGRCGRRRAHSCTHCHCRSRARSRSPHPSAPPQVPPSPDRGIRADSPCPASTSPGAPARRAATSSPRLQTPTSAEGITWSHRRADRTAPAICAVLAHEHQLGISCSSGEPTGPGQTGAPSAGLADSRPRRSRPAPVASRVPVARPTSHRPYGLWCRRRHRRLCATIWRSGPRSPAATPARRGRSRWAPAPAAAAVRATRRRER